MLFGFQGQSHNFELEEDWTALPNSVSSIDTLTCKVASFVGDFEENQIRILAEFMNELLILSGNVILCIFGIGDHDIMFSADIDITEVYKSMVNRDKSENACIFEVWNFKLTHSIRMHCTQLFTCNSVQVSTEINRNVASHLLERKLIRYLYIERG